MENTKVALLNSCKVGDQYCSNKGAVRCKSFCAKHYSRFTRTGNATLLKVNTRPRKAGVNENWCGKCSCFKDVSEFSRSRDRSNGLTSICKKCASIRFKKGYNSELKSKHWEKRLTRLYGISAQEYSSLLERQNGFCAICKKKTKTKLAVDHCHKSGKVRGLLCFRCNSTLGKVEDSQELLAYFIEYLKK